MDEISFLIGNMENISFFYIDIHIQKYLQLSLYNWLDPYLPDSLRKSSSDLLPAY